MGIVGMLVGISVVGACLAEAEIQIKGEINKAKKIVKIGSQKNEEVKLMTIMIASNVKANWRMSKRKTRIYRNK